MSEELKKQAREFLRQSFDARWKRADPESGISREEQQITTMVEFASQVCEQRAFEKGHWQGQKRNYDALIGKLQVIVHKFHGENERWSDFDVLDQGVSLIAERAEAAELALQQANAAHEEEMKNYLGTERWHLRIQINNLNSALQAKEQELAELKSRIFGEKP